jgi:hypothetical protein
VVISFTGKSPSSPLTQVSRPVFADEATRSFKAVEDGRLLTLPSVCNDLFADSPRFSRASEKWRPAYHFEQSPSPRLTTNLGESRKRETIPYRSRLTAAHKSSGKIGNQSDNRQI